MYNQNKNHCPHPRFDITNSLKPNPRPQLKENLCPSSFLFHSFYPLLTLRNSSISVSRLITLSTHQSIFRTPSFPALPSIIVSRDLQVREREHPSNCCPLSADKCLTVQKMPSRKRGKNWATSNGFLGCYLLWKDSLSLELLVCDSFNRSA